MAPPGTPITWEVVVAIVTVLGLVISLWWVVDGKINQVRTTAATDVDDAHKAAAVLAGELAAYKLHVAETYMTKSSGGAAIDRNTVAVETMATSLKSEIGRVETQIVSRLERMENRVFNGNGSTHKS